MPILDHTPITPAGEIGIWKIEESEEWFLEHLDLHPIEEQELEEIKGYKHLQWLAVRKLVHHMSGRQNRMPFVKDEFGKPQLIESEFEISVSHTDEFATAIAAPKLVGIDAQHFVQKIERIASKFMTDEEIAALDPEHRLEHMHFYWAAKEAMYKAYGRRKLDFKGDIFVDPFPYKTEGGICKGLVKKDDVAIHFDCHYSLRDGFYLVWCREK